MRADALTFADLFEVDPGSGRIRLGADRYVMLDADAVGNLRKELIENLGWDAARGLFERVGYRSGRNDARQLRARYPWHSEEEWLRAGPRLHFLEGMVRVGLTRLETSRPDRKFLASGDWHDSYEAEQHLKHFRPGTRSVCWTLEGYATGYATEFFGEEITCIETRCRGKGDPVCGFEVRTALDWGAQSQNPGTAFAGARFNERFDRCLRAMGSMGCELGQSSLDAIFTTDPSGVITSCSQGGSELFDLLPGEAVGRKIGDFYAGAEVEAHHVMDRLVREGRGAAVHRGREPAGTGVA
jgi:PAS domain-containing protein